VGRVVLLVEQEVLRLDISVTYTILVQVTESVERLLHDVGGLSLGQMLFLSDVVKELASLTNSTDDIAVRK
jgi:hypothetical protein